MALISTTAALTDAEKIKFNPTGSGLSAVNVQAALIELDARASSSGALPLIGEGQPTATGATASFNGQLYFDSNTAPTGRVQAWVWLESLGHWYPLGATHVAAYLDDSLTLSDEAIVELTMIMSETLTMSELAAVTLTNILSDEMSLSDAAVVQVQAVNSDQMTLSETCHITFPGGNSVLNGGALNTQTLN